MNAGVLIILSFFAVTADGKSTPTKTTSPSASRQAGKPTVARRAVKLKAVKPAVGPTLAQSKTSGVKSRKASTTTVTTSSTIARSSHEYAAESVIHEGEVGCESCGRVHGHGHGAGVPCPWHGTCDMPQRIPYFAEWNTYFYFRPYNYLHLARQRDLAVNWGGDARHPYANEMFKNIYDGLEEPEELEEVEGDIEPEADEEMLDEPMGDETLPEVEEEPGALHHNKVKQPKRTAGRLAPLVRSSLTKGWYKVISPK